MASIEEGNGMVMPVGPMYGGNGMGNGFGGDGWWIVLLIILLAAGNGFGNGYGNNGGYPNIQQGFDQAALTNGIAGVQSSVCNLGTAIQNGFAQAEIAANARQIADMQQNFAMQQAFSNCCCENRLANANLSAQVTQENCADREALANALYAVTQQMNAGFQSIKDEFCNDRLARKDEVIAELRSQLNERDRLAANNAMESRILANNEAQTVALEQYLAPVPRPAYIVQNPNCCQQGYGYGCVGMTA